MLTAFVREEFMAWKLRACMLECECVHFCLCVFERERLTNPSTELKRVKNTSKGSLTSEKPHRDFKNNK